MQEHVYHTVSWASLNSGCFLCNGVLQNYDVLFWVLCKFEHCQIFLTMNLILATSYFEPKPDLMPVMLLGCMCFVVEESKRTSYCCFLFLTSEDVTLTRFVHVTLARFACIMLARFFSCSVGKVLHTFSTIFLHFYLSSFTYLCMVFHWKCGFYNFSFPFDFLMHNWDDFSLTYTYFVFPSLS